MFARLIISLPRIPTQCRDSFTHLFLFRPFSFRLADKSTSRRIGGRAFAMGTWTILELEAPEGDARDEAPTP